MFLSGNPEVAFPPTTVMNSLITNLPTLSLTGASANLVTGAATAVLSSLSAVNITAPGF
jgi:hypothetical protein